MNITMFGDVAALFAALAKAQAEMGGAVKGDKNPFFKSKYANLTSVISAVAKPLADHGLSVIQMPGWDHGANQPTLTTMLCHEGGGCIQSTASAPFAKGKTGPQEYGSVTTYLRRYSLQAVLAVPTVDDDAEAAQMVVRKEEKAQKEEAKKEAVKKRRVNGSKKASTTDSTASVEVVELTLAESLTEEIARASRSDMTKLARRMVELKEKDALSVPELEIIRTAYAKRLDEIEANRARS